METPQLCQGMYIVVHWRGCQVWDFEGIRSQWCLDPQECMFAENHICMRTALVFGRAIIWACFGPRTSSHTPQVIVDRVNSQYTRICTLEPTLKAIRKVGLVVRVCLGQLLLTILLFMKRTRQSALQNFYNLLIFCKVSKIRSVLFFV